MFVIIKPRRVLYRLVGLWATDQPPNAIHCCSIWFVQSFPTMGVDKSNGGNQVMVNISWLARTTAHHEAKVLNSDKSKVLSGGIVDSKRQKVQNITVCR